MNGEPGRQSLAEGVPVEGREQGFWIQVELGSMLVPLWC